MASAPVDTDGEALPASTPTVRRLLQLLEQATAFAHSISSRVRR